MTQTGRSKTLRVPSRSTVTALNFLRLATSVVAGLLCVLFAIGSSQRYESTHDTSIVEMIPFVIVFGGWAATIYAVRRVLGPHWRIARQGVVVKGLRASRLLALSASGELKPSDAVSRGGHAEWVVARKVEGLFSDRQLLHYAASRQQVKDSSTAPVPIYGGESLAYTLGSLVGNSLLQRAAISFTVLIVGIGLVTWLFIGPRPSKGADAPDGGPKASPRVEILAPFVAPRPSMQVDTARAEIQGSALGGAPTKWVQAAEAYLERAYQEEILAARARHESDYPEARKHDQRVADYLMAARFYVHQGREPPGFDADLATK